MNKIYRVVWNKATQTWAAVCEYAKAQGKSSGSDVVGEMSDKRMGGRFAYTMVMSGLLIATGQVAYAATVADGTGLNAIVIQGASSTATATGADSLAAGTNAAADGNSALAIGTDSKATGAYATAVGANVTAGGLNSITIGRSNNVTGRYTTVIGSGNIPKDGKGLDAAGGIVDVKAADTITATHSSIIGMSNQIAVSSVIGTPPPYAAVLTDVQVQGNDNIINRGHAYVFGSNNTINTNASNMELESVVAVGRQNTVSGNNSLAVGRLNTVAGGSALAVGINSQALGTDGIAIGNKAYASTSENSVAIGGLTHAGQFGTALGARTSVEGDQGAAVATGAVVKGARAVAVGSYSFAGTEDAVALGHNTAATGPRAVAMGAGSVVSGARSGAWGIATNGGQPQNNTTDRSFVGGTDSYAIGNKNIIGDKSSDSFVLGNNVKLGATGASIAITNVAGRDGTTNASTRTNAVTYTGATAITGAVALGSDTSVTVDNGVALGKGSVASTAAGQAGTDPLSAKDATASAGVWTATHAAVSVGNGTTVTRQITSVAAGTQDTDAVNVAQLKAAGFTLKATSSTGGESTTVANDKIQNGETVTVDAGKNIKVTHTANQVSIATKDEVEFTKITLGDSTNNTVLTSTTDGLDVGGDKITNVANGDVNANSTDAVNGSQLYAAQAAATTKVEGDKGVSVTPTTNADGSKTYTVAAKTDNTTVKVDDKGNIAAVTAPLTYTDGKVNTPAAPNALATAGDIANAINSSGWKLAADGTTGTELINPSDTVTFKTGSSNLTVKRDGANITYDLAKDININSVKFGNNGPTIKADASNNINIAKSDGSATKITNVEAGTGDNDAANVSQLKAAQAAATTKVEGDKGVSVTPTTNADGSKTYTVAAKTDNTTVKVDDKGNIAAVTAPLTYTDGKVNTPAAPNALATAGDIANAINNSGWKLAADGTRGTELINPSDTVTFKTGSSNLTVKRDGANITYDLAKDININSVKFGNNGPKITNDGDNIKVGAKYGKATKITNVKAGEANTDAVNVSQLKAAQAAATTKVEGDKGVSVTPKTNNDGSTTYTVAAKTDGTTVKVDGNGNIAAVTTTFTPSTDGKVGAPVGNGDSLVTANTVANAINNSGWKLAADGTTGTELINPSDTVTFKTGSSNLTVKRDGANITYDLAKDININSVKFGDNGPTIKADASNNINIAKSDGSPTKITNVEAGTGDNDAVNVSQLKAAQAAATTKVEGDKGVSVTPTTNADGSKTYTVAAKTDNTTVKVDDNGNIAAVTTTFTPSTDGKVGAPVGNGDSLVTANTVANAINNSGWKLAADGTTGTELINPSDTVTFKTGSSNLTVKRDGANITYDLAKDININSVKFGDNGPTIKADASNNINIAKSDGSPTKITNVEAGTGDNDAVNVSQLKAAQAAATTKVEGDKGVSVTPTTNADGSKTYTVAAKTDNTTVKVDDKGNIAAVTAPLTTNTDGKVNTPAAPNALATAGDIANAINSSGWKLAADGTTGTELINPSDTVTFKTGSSNLTVKRDGANITYDLAKDININSVKFGNNGPTIKADASNNINIAKSDGSPTKITNVEAGTGDNDAVNVSQLKAAQAAATTKVEGDKGVSVTPTTNADGSKTYTVAAKTDNTTVKVDDNGNIAAVTTPLTNTDGKVNTPAAPKALATAGGIANAINNSGFTLTAQGSNGSLVKPGATVDMNNTDGNIVISKSASDNNVTYNLAKDLKVGSVTAGDTVVNNDGITINNGSANGNTVSLTKDGLNNGGNRITNVAPGVNATDAVNVSQLQGLAHHINNRIDDVSDDANAGVSSAMAMAALPQAYLPGKSMLTGGIASYNGEGAVAVGFSKLSDNGRWVLKVSGSADTQGNAGGAVGAGFHF